MSKTPHNNYPPKHETLKPRERLLVASERILHMHGKKMDSRDNKVITNARWDDVDGQRSFRLQRQVKPPFFKTDARYYIEVYPIFSDIDPLEQYYFDMLDGLKVKDEGWRKVTNIAETLAVTKLLEYFDTASDLTAKEQNAFLKIMMDNDIRAPGRLEKVREFAANIFKLHRKK